jgi:hypothetical protein
MDLLKHGESSYPADAWVEAQYMKDGGMGVSGRARINTYMNCTIHNCNCFKAELEGMEEENGKAKEDDTKKGLPPNMRFSRTASYNNPHEMFPAASKMFSGTLSVVKTGVADSMLHWTTDQLL